MKIKEIGLSNISKYDQVSINLDPNVTYLVGKNGAGKSTLGITGPHFIFQGIAEKRSGDNDPIIGERFRFIGPKAASGTGYMVLYDEKTQQEIKVTRKLTKTGSELSFEGPEGMVLNQQWLTDLFNIFLIAPKKFTELTPKGQAKALGIDTAKIDEEIGVLKQDATYIGRVIKGFGELAPVEEVAEVSLTDLMDEKMEIVRFNQDQKNAADKIDAANKKMADIDRDRKVIADKIEVLIREIKEQERLDAILAERSLKGADVIADLPKPLPEKTFTEIDEKIAGATLKNKQASDYATYIKNKSDLNKQLALLENNKKDQKSKEQERIDYVKKFKFPFSNLSIGDGGELLLDSKPIKEPYFSTGEIIKLVPVLIASQNPDLKYVFLQDFNLLDEDKQEEIIKYFNNKGFQLVIEYVAKSVLPGKNCILLSQNKVVEGEEKPELV